jgi:2-polyprenyl-3-methyl-5-hydroxy-6-metoxy-1,4-benzoquinol methylase
MLKVGNPEAVAARVARERAAHEDNHIHDALRKWYRVFPHVFSNPAMDRFYAHEVGSVQDKLTLDFGCGQGEIALWLVAHGAMVFGIDVSEFNIERCKEKANARKLDPDRYSFTVMDAHQTMFPDKFFDLVLGNGILHHLDLPAAVREIDRVLKPGAKAIFREPLGGNPLLRIYRMIAGIHTLDERPLTRNELRYLTEQWGFRTKYSGLVTLPVALLTSIILRPYPTNWMLRAAAHVEDKLNSHHVRDDWNRDAILAYEPGYTRR